MIIQLLLLRKQQYKQVYFNTCALLLAYVTPTLKSISEECPALYLVFYAILEISFFTFVGEINILHVEFSYDKQAHWNVLKIT